MGFDMNQPPRDTEKVLRRLELAKVAQMIKALPMPKRISIYRSYPK